MSDWQATLARKAELRDRAGLRRELRPRPAAEPMVDLAGNDYLGLSRHPQVIAAASAALDAYGLGATGSRLVRGTTELHTELEQELAAWIGAADALVYSSGYLANLGVVRALVTPQTVLIADEHVHASLIDGCRLAGARTVTYRHADPDHLASLLGEHRKAVVLTESVFSVDGDLAPLRELHDVARAHHALLLIDDAHGLGVVEDSTAGLAGADDVVITATLSKALGGAGGVVAGPSALVRHLIDTGRTFIFDTALPPAVAAGVRVAARLAITSPELRVELRSRSLYAHRRLADAGFRVRPAAASADPASAPPARVSGPAGGIVSVEAPSAELAATWAAECRRTGVAVGCFRPPSTPDHVSRLRLTINVGVPRAAFEQALEKVVEAAP
ncbi:8-amino-7-oxononanoate synthase [Hamadaea sp. NPDC051192]|uniref:8-amino-7-oxononanoate synthase n=1 Tax=Hamadaea sp. NPDC051192 TaxID=3154940 RepID=UPI00342223EE